MDMREKDGPAGEVVGPSSDPAGVEASLHRNGELPGDVAVPAVEASNAPVARSLLAAAHPYPGRLIAVEGIDGSGKSTQLRLLERWLRARGYPVHFTEWNSSRLVRRAMSRGKKKNLLTPTTFSLLHAVDFADRLTYQILAPLKERMIVLVDRDVYIAFPLDVGGGVHPQLVGLGVRSQLRR